MIVVKLFDINGVFVEAINAVKLDWKRQKNKEYSFDIELCSAPSLSGYKVQIIDTEQLLRVIPSGYITNYDGETTITVSSWEASLGEACKIPDDWQWWDRKTLTSIIRDHCYGFRKLTYAGLTALQSALITNNVVMSELDDSNGDMYLDTFQYLSSSELAYQENGYAIYKIQVPTEARRSGMVLRWVDSVGTTTDISVQFGWSDDSTGSGVTYSTEQSPARSDSVTPNQTRGVDIPEGSLAYLYVKFNLKYDKGTNGVNYEQEITTVEGSTGNIVYYGSTPILNAFEVIYRTNTQITPGTISVGSGILTADIHGKSDNLESLKAIAEACDLVFFCTTDSDGAVLLNAYSSYVNDMKNEIGCISNTLNASVSSTKKDLNLFDGCDCYGSGDGIDRLHVFVKNSSVENPKNITTFDDSDITSVSELETAGLAHLESENTVDTTVEFEWYGLPVLQLHDSIPVDVSGTIYTDVISEEAFTYDANGLSKRSYVLGVKTYPLSLFLGSAYTGEYLKTIPVPTNIKASRGTDGIIISWKGSSSSYLIEYARNGASYWSRLSSTGNSITLNVLEDNTDYTFKVYGVEDDEIGEPAYTILNSAIARDANIELIVGTPSISRSRANELSPGSITASAIYSGTYPYNCFFVIDLSSDGSTYVNAYTSAAKENLKTLSVPVSFEHEDLTYYTNIVRIRIYSESDLTVLKGEFAVSVVADVSTTPVYLGSLSAPPESSLVVNDYYFDNNTSALGGGVLKYWTGYEWDTMEYTHILYASAVKTAIADMVAWCTDNSGIIGDVTTFVTAIMNNIITRNAIIDYLATSTQVSTALCDDGTTRRMEIDWDNAIEYLRNADQSKVMKLTDALLKSEIGQLVKKRSVSVDGDAISWLDSPASGTENLIGRISRLGVGSDRILMDGKFCTKSERSWSDEFVISPAESQYPTYVQLSDGTLRVAYKNGSTGHLVERIYNSATSSWGSESVINPAESQYPTYIQLSDGTLRVAYAYSLSGYLVERIYNSATSSWGSESVINPVMSGYPTYIQLSDGTLRVAYAYFPSGHLVERIYNSATSSWGSESVINPENSQYPAYIQLSDGTLRVAYKNGSTGYLVERIYNSATSSWGSESVINPENSLYPTYIQLSDGTLRVAYRNGSTGYLVERIYNSATSSWGSESVINPAESQHPTYIQLSDGTLRVAYARASDEYLVERTKEMYSRIAFGRTRYMSTDGTIIDGDEHIVWTSTAAGSITVPAGLEIGYELDFLVNVSSVSALQALTSGTELVEGATSFVVHGAKATASLDPAICRIKKIGTNEWRFTEGVISGRNANGEYQLFPSGTGTIRMSTDHSSTDQNSSKTVTHPYTILTAKPFYLTFGVLNGYSAQDVIMWIGAGLSATSHTEFVRARTGGSTGYGQTAKVTIDFWWRA